MFTLFDLFALTAPSVGAAIGVLIAVRVGTSSAVIGAIIGALVGQIMGKLPLFFVLKALNRSFRKRTTEQLRAKLLSETCFVPNIILMELSSRGENIMQDLPVVIDMLESDNFSRRSFGWAAITSAFPELAQCLSGYRLNDSVDECKRKTLILRNMIERTDMESPPQP